MGSGPKATGGELLPGRCFLCWGWEMLLEGRTFSPLALGVMGGLFQAPLSIEMILPSLELCHWSLETTCPVLVLMPLVPDMGTVGQGADGCHLRRVERETAARISEEIGNLMKEIETLVEEKAKESADMSKFIREGVEGWEGRWDGDLHVLAASSRSLPVGGGRSKCLDPCLPQCYIPRLVAPVLLIPFVPQGVPWCMKEPVSP